MALENFSLVPADDPQSSPQEDLDAAVQGALALADDPSPVAEDAPIPFGRSWLFDWQAGQFVHQGAAPAPAVGFSALAEWCEMAIHTARYSSPLVSDEFGMEKPDSVIGSLMEDEVLADWQASLVEALLVHDRITSVENIILRWEPTEGVLYVDSLDVITDEDETVTVSDLALKAGG